MTDDITRHCQTLSECNQRGGRILSVVDLIDAGTIQPDLAAYALAAIGKGSSFFVGSAPKRAGKTTIMCALLNFVPVNMSLAVVEDIDSIQAARASADGKRCVICEEIGKGRVPCYLWGEELPAYFDLAANGHMLASNLHADTYEQTFEQICRTNPVAEDAFARVNLLFFISVKETAAGIERQVVEAWESDGNGPHRRVYAAEAGGLLETPATVTALELASAQALIDDLLASRRRTIEEVREFIVAHSRG